MFNASKKTLNMLGMYSVDVLYLFYKFFVYLYTVFGRFNFSIVNTCCFALFDYLT